MAKPSSNKNRKMRKYIHSITVDFTECIAPKGAKQRDLKPQHTTESLEKLCQHLCEKESTYLNTQIISK
jgi:hypothetical protein